MIIISPSVLAADFANLASELDKVEKAGAEYIHLDVMDGMFVPNISFGAPVISALRKHSEMVFDVHLMINEPRRYIDDFIKAGADIITIHYESCADPLGTLRYIKSKGVRAGLAIKPATLPAAVFDLLPDTDMLLVMTVEPGFGGQKLIPETIPKISAIKNFAQEHSLLLDIEVDGGITPDNVSLLTEAGANIIVAGSAIFKAANPSSVVKQMKG